MQNYISPEQRLVCFRVLFTVGGIVFAGEPLPCFSVGASCHGEGICGLEYSHGVGCLSLVYAGWGNVLVIVPRPQRIQYRLQNQNDIANLSLRRNIVCGCADGVQQNGRKCRTAFSVCLSYFPVTFTVYIGSSNAKERYLSIV